MKSYSDNKGMQSISEVIVNHDPICPHCGKTIYASESWSGRPAYKKPRDQSAMVQFENPLKEQNELLLSAILFEPVGLWLCTILALFGPSFDLEDAKNEAGS